MPLIKYTIYKTISKTIRAINSRDFYFPKVFQDIYVISYGKKLHKFLTMPPPPHTHKLKSYQGPQILYLNDKLNHFLALLQVTCKSSLPVLLKSQPFCPDVTTAPRTACWCCKVASIPANINTSLFLAVSHLQF